MRRLIHAAVLVVTASAQTISMVPKGAYTLFDTAESTAAPPDEIFQSTAAMQSWLPPRFLAPGLVGAVAIPTNTWWGNAIASTSDPIVQPMWTNPYSLRPQLVAAPFGLATCYSFPTRFFGDVTGNGVGTNRFYAHTFVNDVVFSATQFTSAPQFQVTGWDDLSVTLRFSPSGSTTTTTTTTAASPRFDATLVPGMALVTAKYTALTPRLVVASAIASINGVGIRTGSSVTSARFVIRFANDQRWVIYTGTSVTLWLRDAWTLEASAVYTGYVRAGVVTSNLVLAFLDRTSRCLLEGSNVEAQDASSYMFHLKTSGTCPAGIFHYLHVHQIDTLDRTSALIASGASTQSPTRGMMTGVLTRTNPPVIRLVETQSAPAAFYPPRRPTPSVVEALRLKDTLIDDLNATWTLPRDGSYYFNGKAAHKYANLCLVANDDAVTGADKRELLRTCLDKLETVLAPFVANSWTFPLQFDSVYRGIVSSIGFALRDVNADFGNPIYNDHHYHYGYWIATAAIVNVLDPSWSGLPQLNRIASTLVRDVANPTTNDPFFPKFRSFDWYRGHSLSHGVTPFNDGKDQESASEDINFHYALALYGQATNNAALATIGQLMLKLNTRAVQTYFLMDSDNRVHPPTIIPNKVTGIFYDNKADYTTWFSREKFAGNIYFLV